MISEFTEKQPTYRYFPLSDGSADVFIYDYIGEKINPIEQVNYHIEYDEELGQEVEKREASMGEQVVYQYNVFFFNCSQKEITEDMIKENPMDYFGYEKTSEEIEQIDYLLDLDYRLCCLELGLDNEE